MERKIERKIERKRQCDMMVRWKMGKEASRHGANMMMLCIKV